MSTQIKEIKSQKNEITSDFSKSFSKNVAKFVNWLFENYQVKNNFTGKNASKNDINLFNFVEPKRKKMESFFKFIIESDFTVWSDEKMIDDENEVISNFNNPIEKPTKKPIEKTKKSEVCSVIVTPDIDTSETFNIDTLECYTDDLISLFGNPLKNGGKDDDHRYEWKITVGKDIYTIYDWKNDENTFDDFKETTWYLGSTSEKNKTKKFLMEYIEKNTKSQEEESQEENIEEAEKVMEEAEKVMEEEESQGYQTQEESQEEESQEYKHQNEEIDLDDIEF